MNVFVDVDGFVRLARRLAVSGNFGVWFDGADVEKRYGLFVVDASRVIVVTDDDAIQCEDIVQFCLPKALQLGPLACWKSICRKEP